MAKQKKPLKPRRPDGDMQDVDFPDDDMPKTVRRHEDNGEPSRTVEHVRPVSGLSPVKVPERKMVRLGAAPAAKKGKNKQHKRIDQEAFLDTYVTRMAGEIRKTVAQARVALLSPRKDKNGKDGEPKKVGRIARCLVGDEIGQLMVAIPIPALAMEYLFKLEGWPLGFVLGIEGEWGSLKSPLAFEMCRWFGMNGGIFEINEHESKISETLLRSVLTQRYYKRCTVNRCHSVEDWQACTTDSLQKHQKFMTGTKKEPGPGRTIPVAIVVDSVMGKLSRATQQKILEAGYAEPGYPREADIITRYLKTISGVLDEWPFSLIFINQLKYAIDTQGNKKNKTAGGMQIGYQQSFELETQIVKSKLKSMDFDGVQIRVICHKNSHGNTHRKIETRMLWWDEEDPETGHAHQRTVWDWDWATIHLLSHMDGREAANLKEIGFHLQVVNSGDVTNSCWSKTLGIKEDAPVPWHEAGAMIRQNSELMDQLRWALRIHRVPILESDYQKQMEKIRENLP